MPQRSQPSEEFCLQRPPPNISKRSPQSWKNGKDHFINPTSLSELTAPKSPPQKHTSPCQKEAAKEGMVLLKNNESLLPFQAGTKLALFGKGSFDYVKGGGGSGDVTVAYTTNLYEGFKKLPEKVEVYEALSDYYRKEVEKQYEAGAEPGMTVEPAFPEETAKKARAYTDTAVICISRFSGEGWDRKSSYDKEMDESVQTDPLLEKAERIFPDGDFYLTKEESAMVEQVQQLFPKVAVVMNVGGMVDTDWFAENEKIQAVLMAWQGGMEGGSAAAELLCGVGSPSGKLSDTFAKKLEDYPSSETFHESVKYVDYKEDIYVGYRYFETIPGADKAVNYPFGYGLSYTTFERALVSAEEKQGVIRVSVNVTNTGKYPGKEVLPAGIFYYNVKDPMIKEKIDADVEAVSGRILKELKMNGLVRADREMIEKMDRSLVSLPVAFNKDGSFRKNSSVATREQFDVLGRFVKQKIENIRSCIMEGDVEVNPYKMGKKSACAYCPYISVCGFDRKMPGYEYRNLKVFDDKELWQIFEEEE